MGRQAGNCNVHSRDEAKAQGVLGGTSLTGSGPDLFELYPVSTGDSQTAPGSPGLTAQSLLGKSKPVFPCCVLPRVPMVFQALKYKKPLGNLLALGTQDLAGDKIIPPELRSLQP